MKICSVIECRNNIDPVIAYFFLPAYAIGRDHCEYLVGLLLLRKYFRNLKRGQDRL